MLTQPSEPAQLGEPNTATGRSTHSRTYERWMGLLFVLGTVGLIFAIFFVLSFFD